MGWLDHELVIIEATFSQFFKHFVGGTCLCLFFSKFFCLVCAHFFLLGTPFFSPQLFLLFACFFRCDSELIFKIFHTCTLKTDLWWMIVDLCTFSAGSRRGQYIFIVYIIYIMHVCTHS